MTAPSHIKCVPLTPDRWSDFELLFGRNGACVGCWCMYWRLPGPEWRAGCGAENKERFARIVASGREPGLIAYVGGQPAAWCSIAPRDEFTRLERSPVRKRFDDLPTWSITCFFTARAHRRSGLMLVLLRAALDHAKQHGAQVVEGYPVELKGQRLGSGGAGYTGIASTFRRAGFRLHAKQARGKRLRRYRYVF